MAKRDLDQHLGSRSETAVHLLNYAIWNVEGLYELAEVDQEEHPHGSNKTPRGYRATAIRMAHAQWGASTAVSALDRVAAAFGELYLRAVDDAQRAVAGKKARNSRSAFALREVRDKWLGELPVAEQGWILDVLKDPNYSDKVAFLRHPLTHRTTPRRLTVEIGPNGYSYGEALIYNGIGGKKAITAHELVVQSRDVAERHVRAAIRLLCT